MASSQGQLLPWCFSCNSHISGRTIPFCCRSCDRNYHPKSVRGLGVGTYNELNGRPQCRFYTTEQTSAAEGPSHAAGPSSGASDDLANTASPSEIVLEYLKKSKTNVKVMRHTPNSARIPVANVLEQLMREVFNAVGPAGKGLGVGFCLFLSEL